MPKYASGKHALAISDRSGLQFPWREMVTEWTGAFVHISEYEPKQPQLRPKTLSADSISLSKVRPARTAFPTPTILPNNPFDTVVGTTVTVTQPNHNFVNGDAIRFRDVEHDVGGVAISTLELETTLAGAINSTVKTLTLTDSSQFPSSGYIYIQTKPEKNSAGYPLATQSTFTQSEVIKYTANDTGTGVLSGLTRGSSAPLYGLTPQSSTATAHNNLDKVFGSYSITRVTTSQLNPPGVPATVISNQYTFSLVNAATSATSGGGFPSFAGPVGDRP
jgi:hypothetical protein